MTTSDMPPPRWSSKAKIWSTLSFIVDMALVCAIVLIFFINKFPYEDDHGIIKYYIRANFEETEIRNIGDTILEDAQSQLDYEGFKKKLLSNNPGIENSILHPTDIFTNTYDMISHGYKQLIVNGRFYYTTITMVNMLKECFAKPIDESRIPNSCHFSLHNKYERNQSLSDDEIKGYKFIQHWLASANSDASKSSDVIDLLNHTRVLYADLINLKESLSDIDSFSKNKVQSMIDETASITAKSFDESANYVEIPDFLYSVFVSIIIYILFKTAHARFLYVNFMGPAVIQLHTP